METQGLIRLLPRRLRKQVGTSVLTEDSCRRIGNKLLPQGEPLRVGGQCIDECSVSSAVFELEHVGHQVSRSCVVGDKCDIGCTEAFVDFRSSSTEADEITLTALMNFSDSPSYKHRLSVPFC